MQGKLTYSINVHVCNVIMLLNWHYKLIGITNMHMNKLVGDYGPFGLRLSCFSGGFFPIAVVRL